MAEFTPMMKQYFSVKDNYEDAILFYRLGDFYEMFFQDAITASQELDLVLTGRDCGQAERAPMCGVPFHSADGYIAKLVARGYKVAICEQLENPAEAKGVVKRDVVRVITPGTVCDGDMLDEGKNNFLCCVYAIDKRASVCFADLSTGQVFLTELSGEDVEVQIENELGKYRPSELIVNQRYSKNRAFMLFVKNRIGCVVNVTDEDEFDFEECKNTVTTHFRVSDVSELFGSEYTYAVSALGKTLEYMRSTQKKSADNITNVEFYLSRDYMSLNLSTRRNLELTETMRNGAKKGSLLSVIDKTKTAMGKRLMRSWVDRPLISLPQIINRHNAVEELFSEPAVLEEICDLLKNVKDMERLMTRVVYATANARVLRTLADTFSCLPNIKSVAGLCKSTAMREIFSDIDELLDVRELIESSIVDEPPFSVREGGMIRKGYNKEIDELRDIMENGKGIIADIEAREQESTGIKKLKVSYNRVFGYYIEVLNTYKELVPEHYIRKQTLSNCERYITGELKELEEKILGAKDRSIALEYELFSQIRDIVAQNYTRIQKTANALSKLDVLCSFASVAVSNNYVRPEMTDKDVIDIKEGRHPVVEALSGSALFVPNDTLLDCSDNRLAIITGPNMAGKSTYMRQVALISLMAQIGSFVPAMSATMCIVDNIFTRIGASDDLASGQSTFMVEMSEVAEILKSATKKSLIIFDEIGRGTSTFDGMSIARAVLEYTADTKKLGAKTLFATHYHELTDIENQLDGIKNYNIAVKKRGDDITFLRRIIRGSADDSYGIEVSKLAGVPDSVVQRAKEVLKSLESGTTVAVKTKKSDVQENNDQFSMFSMGESEIVTRLKTMDINTLTPIEAMSTLYELINEAKKI